MVEGQYLIIFFPWSTPGTPEANDADRFEAGWGHEKAHFV